MRKYVTIETEEALCEFTCDDYKIIQAAGGGLVFVTFEGGRDDDGGVVHQVVFSGTPFALTALAAPDGEVITIPRAEYEGLKETIAILSDPNAVADIKQAEADVAAGNLTNVQDLDLPRN